MVTISRVVEKIVERSPFIQEAIAKEIVNYAALALNIKKEVEYEMKQKVKDSAIMMALRRFNEKLGENFCSQVKFDKHSEITIQSNLIIFMIKRTWETQKKLQEVYSISDNKPGVFLAVTQGLHEINILTTDNYDEHISNLFKNFQVQKKLKNLCGITLKFHEEFLETPGFIYTITRALLWENINILDIISTFTELMIIVDERDSGRCFEVLRTLIHAR